MPALPWGPAEYRTAKRLLSIWSYEQISDAIDYVVRGWPTIAARFWPDRPVGVPTIATLERLPQLVQEGAVVLPALGVHQDLLAWRAQHPAEQLPDDLTARWYAAADVLRIFWTEDRVSTETDRIIDVIEVTS